mgnify:CR=1 FL=1
MTDPAFVSIPWVQSNLEAPGITVIDGSWHMPATGRDARAEFAERALPGAVFFDIEQVADTSADLPHLSHARTVCSSDVSNGSQKYRFYRYLRHSGLIYSCSSLVAISFIWARARGHHGRGAARLGSR